MHNFLDPATGVATFTYYEQGPYQVKTCRLEKNYPDLTVTRYNIISTAT